MAKIMAAHFIWLFVALCLASTVSGLTSSFHLRRRLNARSSVDRPNVKLPAAQWFTQRLDHFNDAEIRTWKQRYFVNDTFYAEGGPAFVMIGGEGPADPIWSVEGYYMTWAKQFGAIAFQLEHRYYGESHPTNDVSVKNLQYLSSEQALADLAAFRTEMAEKYKLQNASWIFFGGSYSGSLAAWVRLKYPHLVDGSVASSAPLLAKIDFKEYLGVVRTSLYNVSSTCNSAIENAVSQIDNFLAQGRPGWNQISDKFQLCEPLNGHKTKDVANLFSILCGNFEGVVQYNKDNRIFEGALATDVTIETICNIMDNDTIGPEIDRYAEVNSLLMAAYNESCVDFTYQSMISSLRNVSWDSQTVKSGTRQWTYQTCTEFGFYQSSDLEDQPFGPKFPVDFFVNQCADVYGPKFNQSLLASGVKQTNTIYGAKGIRVSKVVFPNGSVDPWHFLGLTNDTSDDDVKAIFIQGTAHCADTYPSSPNDPPQLTEARQLIQKYISSWIH